MAYRKKSSGSENRKRAPIIGFRATEDERARIQSAAARAGLTVGSYVRSQSLKKPTTRAVRRPSVETVQLAQILGLLGVLGGALQCMAPTATPESTTLPDELEAAVRDYRQVTSAIMKALRRKPHDH